MENFDIIGALETAAEANGWHFIFGLNREAFNIATQLDFTDGSLVLMADCRVLPEYSGTSYDSIKYTCQLWLGQKFDATGLSATLDETDKQKYDRRLKGLLSTMADFIGTFKCDNDLTMTLSDMTLEKNVFDTNIDYVIEPNVIFTQTP